LVLQAIELCAQAPAPLQLPTGVSIPLVQLALPHMVEVVGFTQVRELPSHCPRQVPEPTQRLRDGVPPVRGSPWMRLQVPTAPASLQDMHWAVQEVSQQYPSAHWPEVHSTPPAHVRPFGLSCVQVPASQ